MEIKAYAIIVTYNAMRWANKCLNSLMDSAIRVEIIVIDNGSTDGTQEFIKNNFTNVLFLQSKENLGFGRANNIGIKKAYDEGADYVFLINQDVWIEKNTLELLLKAQSVSPEYGILSPVHLNGAGTALDASFSYYVSPGGCKDFLSDSYLNKLRSDIYEIKFVNAAMWLISRKCIEIVGGFTPVFFLYGEDQNYIERIIFHGFKVGVLPSSKIYHDREERESNPSFDLESFEEIQKLMHYCNPNSDPDIFSDIKKYKRSCIKHLFFFRFSEFRKTRKIIRQLSKNQFKLFNVLQMTKTTGKTFLNEPY